MYQLLFRHKKDGEYLTWLDLRLSTGGLRSSSSVSASLVIKPTLSNGLIEVASVCWLFMPTLRLLLCTGDYSIHRNGTPSCSQCPSSIAGGWCTRASSGYQNILE